MEILLFISGAVLGTLVGGGATWLLMRRAPGSPADADLAARAEERDRAARAEGRLDVLDSEASRLRTALADETKARAAAELDRERVHTRMVEQQRRLEETEAFIRDAREKLAETFKALGGDVLKQSTEQLLVQAKAQLASQVQLSRQDLEARQKAIDASVKPLVERLTEQEKLVRELGEKREGDAKSLGEQLRQLGELQQQTRDAAAVLSSAMKSSRQRGRWGEIALRNIVEKAGMTARCDFTEQATLATAEGAVRPDLVVHLPGGREIPVDSKTPMDAYFDSLDGSLPEEKRKERLVAHAAALRNHVRSLAKREYASLVAGRVDFTVLFIPVESSLLAALEEDPSLHPMALDSGILLASPTMLLVILRTIALNWNQAQITESAQKIAECGRTLLERITKFTEYLGGVGGHLAKAVKSYNEAVASFESRLAPAARQLSSLAGSAPPESLELIDSPLRSLLPAADERGEK